MRQKIRTNRGNVFVSVDEKVHQCTAVIRVLVQNALESFDKSSKTCQTEGNRQFNNLRKPFFTKKIDSFFFMNIFNFTHVCINFYFIANLKVLTKRNIMSYLIFLYIRCILHKNYSQYIWFSDYSVSSKKKQKIKKNIHGRLMNRIIYHRIMQIRNPQTLPWWPLVTCLSNLLDCCTSANPAKRYTKKMEKKGRKK